MKKGDILIILSVLFAAAAALFALWLAPNAGKTVVVSQNNTEIYSVSLLDNRTLILSDNTVEIKNGKVKMAYAGCENQVCVNHKEISKKGESIICLPNKVIVEIK